MSLNKLRKFPRGITLNAKSDKTTVLNFNSEYLSQKMSTQIGPMYFNAFWKGLNASTLHFILMPHSKLMHLIIKKCPI